jgi:hypothetical protein
MGSGNRNKVFFSLSWGEFWGQIFILGVPSEKSETWGHAMRQKGDRFIFFLPFPLFLCHDVLCLGGKSRRQASKLASWQVGEWKYRGANFSIFLFLYA